MIAPASPPDSAEIEAAIANVEALGLVPVLGEHVRATSRYSAESDAHRTHDFNAMARDPKIRAIFAVRGGYGTMRLLADLDYAALARDPKVVMGYSDFTAVLNAVTARSGVVTFHGPVAGRGTPWREVPRELLERALFDPEPLGTLSAGDPVCVVAGRARGRLAGGNLSLAAALQGTPYAIAMHDALVFLEDIGEEPYRIDRMLATLDLAGALRAAAGIVAGQFVDCTGDEPEPSVDDVVARRLRDAGRPAFAGAPAGHVATQWVLPVGALAELDAGAGTLTILEAAVRARD